MRVGPVQDGFQRHPLYGDLGRGQSITQAGDKASLVSVLERERRNTSTDEDEDEGGVSERDVLEPTCTESKRAINLGPTAFVSGDTYHISIYLYM